MVIWLLAALRPSGLDSLLAISAEQGSAKTVLPKMVRALVVPNVDPVRALPREERELFMPAGGNAGTIAVSLGKPLDSRQFADMEREMVLAELFDRIHEEQGRAERLRRR